MIGVRNMNETTLAYLAGCMDSDGYFTIRKDAYLVRQGKAQAPRYHEQIGLRQVTPQVPTLLHELFGGSLYISQPTAKRGRQLYAWHVMSAKASRAVDLLLPYLRIKTNQAHVLLELRASKGENVIKKRNSDGTVARVTVLDREPLEELYQRIRSLNTVGVTTE